MRRSALGASLTFAVALSGAGCQDYNFNPVGKCLIQPATERVRLSDVSSADVLFVIDDSGSMGGEQTALANAFSSFVTNLDAYNQALVTAGLTPFDYHLAVTSTSVMRNPWGDTTPTCRSDCAGNAGNLVCCKSAGQPFEYPRRCETGGCGTGFTCRTTCPGLLGDRYCCNDAGRVEVQAAACTVAGATCGEFSTQYQIEIGSSCVRGAAEDGWKYPQGDFVSIGGNPRVLHFDKSLYQGGTNKNRQGYSSAQLIDFFESSAQVGTCGSGQESALLAARLAVEKALAAKQKDTVNLTGGATWDPATRTAGSPAEWPHEGAKLVLVFVGDEDDCSSPLDPSKGVVQLPNQGPGQDACARDATLPEGSRRQFPVGEFVNYFMGLGRPVGAAFVTSMGQDACGRPGTQACSPGLCQGTCGGTPNCGAQAAGFRLFEAAQGLRGQGADVFTGSICDGNFNLVLDEIANIVRPPAGLVLPSTPAESVVTLLRIAADDGQTRKICRGPAPAGTTQAQARTEGWDWWFTASRDAGDATGATRFVFINQDTGSCRANPGETYSADYIGRLPAEGCTTRADCRATLGGQETDWGCYVPVAGQPGTCICCAAGSSDPACQ